ncbi:hypothetical protein EDC55_12014 [Allofrancisella inopinata]|uniref:hypothetical protein n=1 Tax=Allofrancisella inopinata TaxID=1085647 RepID=UPI0010E8EB63|nr:hypothetical protein [Allofrancisella inopinata]TDT68499.1 hypothetical protein EDC55_12014 [Allofrancisella inopinata]
MAYGFRIVDTFEYGFLGLKLAIYVKNYSGVYDGISAGKVWVKIEGRLKDGR